MTELPLSLPNPLDLFPSKWNDPDVVHEKLVKAGYAEIQAVEYSFQPRVEIERFAKAATVLINTVAKRVWCEEDFARYSPVIESIILKKWRDMYGEIWNGKMTALITIGRKPNSKMIER